jgi:tRNA threonylcarbamoyladenosine biosynthesis protein TsaE
MTETLVCKSLEDLPQAAAAFIRFCGVEKVCLFKGEMGSGKTTFIKAVCEALGVTDTISSPTYSLVNEYETKDSQLIYHFDFYRITAEHEALDMGYEDYLYSGAWCFIEWPERISNLLPQNTVQVNISVQNSQRIITLLK